MTVTQQGHFQATKSVWYHPDINVNIFSLSLLRQIYDITYDKQNNTFYVRDPTHNTTVYTFHESPHGLYYHDLAQETTHHSYVTTVQENKSKYTNYDVKHADGVQKLQKIIGRPNVTDLCHILDHNLLPHCPYNSTDVRAAEHIYGPELGIIKGKTV